MSHNTPTGMRRAAQQLAEPGRFQELDEKNAASGYAGLSASGKLTASQMQEVIALADLSDVAAKSGTGTTVLMQGSPTITTPTIGSMTNAQHNHADAAGGGQLGTAALVDEAVTFAKMQHVTASRLLGRLPGSTGDVQEIAAVLPLQLTASGLEISGWTLVLKKTDQAKASDTVVAADSTLKFPMAANTRYAFRMKAWFTTTATADFNFGHSGPASPTLVHIQHTGIAGGATVFSLIGISTAYTASLGLAGAGIPGMAELNGMILNGANAGDFEFLWAQRGSDVNPTTVLAGSYIEYMAVV